MRWRRKTVVCRQAVEMVTDYLENTMSPADRRRLDAHLVDCPHCDEYFAQMRVMIASVGQIEPAALSDAARGDLVSLYRAWGAASDGQS